MIYILIMYMSMGSGIGLVTPEYNSLEACQAAAEQVVKDMKPWRFSYTCTPKGEKK